MKTVIASHVTKDATHYMKRSNQKMAKILMQLGATRAWLDHTSQQREQLGAACRQMLLAGCCKTHVDAHYKREIETMNIELDAFVARSWEEFSAKEAA